MQTIGAPCRFSRLMKDDKSARPALELAEGSVVPLGKQLQGSWVEGDFPASFFYADPLIASTVMHPVIHPQQNGKGTPVERLMSKSKIANASELRFFRTVWHFYKSSELGFCSEGKWWEGFFCFQDGF